MIMLYFIASVFGNGKEGEAADSGEDRNLIRGPVKKKRKVDPNQPAASTSNVSTLNFCNHTYALRSTITKVGGIDRRSDL